MQPKLSARAGSSTWDSHGQSPWENGTNPADGSRFSSTAMTSTRMTPITNAGITEMMVRKLVIPRSIQVVRRIAASVPSANPEVTPMMSARVATVRLTVRPSLISVLTG